MQLIDPEKSFQSVSLVGFKMRREEEREKIVTVIRDKSTRRSDTVGPESVKMKAPSFSAGDVLVPTAVFQKERERPVLNKGVWAWRDSSPPTTTTISMAWSPIANWRLLDDVNMLQGRATEGWDAFRWSSFSDSLT